jgi:hypothetical protein
VSSNILIVESQAKADSAANDFLMAKTAAEVLTREYPGWMWGVNVDGAQGVATIRNFNLSGQYGYLLKLNAIYSASSFEKDVLRAGGEILERYNQKVGKFDAQRWSELMLDARGIPVGDKS